jgi:tRNA G18 (ribose-2'-O)-methylase SpoU
METRNVIDHYHYWKHEDIVADLDTKRNNFTILCSNLYNDFNIATVIRNANAFLASKVIIYGSKQYDRRGTVGTHRYTHFAHARTTTDLIEEMKNIFVTHSNVKMIGIDNISDAKSIDDYEWDINTHYIIALGQEQVGLPEEIIQMCSELLYIKQYGSVRSLNVGTASGIVMYDYCSKVLTSS